MAELTIRLRRDDATGRLEVRVGLRSDEDALPHEHEHLHRRLVEQLVPGVAGVEADDCPVLVKRERPAREPVLG